MTATPTPDRAARQGITRRRWLGGAAAAAAAAVTGCARQALTPDEAKLLAEADQALRALEERGIRADPYRAGRTMTMSRRGIVATSHMLASQAGLDMLTAGGSAMDAAIAAGAVLGVVEPMSTGLGGDAFFIYYEAATGRLHGLNGSGRSPRGLSREHLASLGKPKIQPHSWEAVTVPGAFDAYVSGLERFGRRPLAEVLAAAIDYARNGFAVTETVAGYWKSAEADMQADPASASTWLVDGKAPQPASVFRNPNLSRTLTTLAEGGRDAFYRGPIAEQIVRYARETGGYLSMQDFADHTSTWVEPITTNYRGYDCHQIPPNGQGIGVLIMLNIVEGFDLASVKHNSARYLHLLIEAKKLAYADMDTYVADPASARLPVAELISKDYAARRRRLIDPRRAADIVHPGTPSGTDTIYLTTIDAEGNACSFINSTYYGFGSKITGGATGIPLQNRGAGFTLEPGHLNAYAPGKRPYHTIIPGMVTRGGKLYLSYGLMGGPMQPQGHLQYLLNHFDFGMTIQEANDVPRWNHVEGLDVLLEHGIPRSVARTLRDMGHKPRPAPAGQFGGSQAVLVDPATGTYLGASDPRKDGAALAY
jgi:gamma-glutamyltranspeptidase/glutathione hydrolase